ncbi:unnamed protein product [Orchesella dallaii]|uniref:Uncharacterized protein n=1 Tax=Orchesella dallaii TaxID=48710 RepID=A0ABP1RHB2_9HEXA
MERFENHTVWTEWGNIFLRPLQTATLEFVWEEILEITTRIFKQCIILQCILLQYSTTYLLKDIKYNTTDNEIKKERMQGAAWLKVLEMHARVITKLKFSAHDIFLVYDSVFPSNRKNFIWQSEIDHNPNRPIKFPTAILTPVRNTLRLFTHNAFVSSFMSVTPLIFINLNDHSISVGCIPCEPSFSIDSTITSEYQMTFETPPKKIAAFKNLIQFWKTLHSTFKLELLLETHCRKLSNVKFGNLKYELCEIYEEYFKYINCSNFMECARFQVNNLGIRKSNIKADGLLFHFNTKIFPCGLEQIDYTLQMLFPKVQFFDANLTAFLTPFTLNIWLFTLAAIAGIVIWRVLVSSDTIFSALFQMYSSLVSQDFGRITGRQPGSTLMIMIWIFSAILLREAYNSSLYSFMTAEQDFEDFPKSMEDLLDRNDFHLILPLSFHDEVMFVLYRWNVDELPTSISTHYMKIFKRAYIMKRSVHKETLEIISSGGTYRMWYYPNSLTQNSTVTEWFDSLRRLLEGNVRTNKFAVLCEGQCEKKWNIALLGNPGLERVKPAQNAFFRSFEFWEIGNPNFFSFTFSKFLGPFVESGIYDLVINRNRLLEKIDLIKTSQNMARLRMRRNFSLVSYALYANGRGDIENEDDEKPTKIKALTGTFIITGIMVVIALFLMMFELLNLRI